MPQLILCVALLLLLVGLHSSFAYTPTSSSSITHPVLIWSGPAHRYLHSAHHPHCPSTISSFNELMSDIAHHREGPLTTGLNETPDAFVTFVFKNMKTSDFMRLTGAFARGEKRENALSALRSHVEEKSSSRVTLSDCSLDHAPLFAIAKNSREVIVRGRTEATELIKSLTSSVSAKTMQFSRLVVMFDSDDQVKEMDSTLDTIVQEINRITKGNYVAMVTSDISDLVAKSGVAMHPHARAALFDSNQVNATATRTELYIDANGLTGIVVGLFLLSIAGFAFYMVSSISASPHITDAFEADEQKKKMQ